MQTNSSSSVSAKTSVSQEPPITQKTLKVLKLLIGSDSAAKRQKMQEVKETPTDSTPATDTEINATFLPVAEKFYEDAEIAFAKGHGLAAKMSYMTAVGLYERVTSQMEPKIYLHRASCASALVQIFWLEGQKDAALEQAEKCTAILEDEKLVPRVLFQDKNYRDLLIAKDAQVTAMAAKDYKRTLELNAEMLKLCYKIKIKEENDEQTALQKRNAIFTLIQPYVTEEQTNAANAQKAGDYKTAGNISQKVIDLLQVVIDDVKKYPGFLPAADRKRYLAFLYLQLAEFNYLAFQSHISQDEEKLAWPFAETAVAIIKNNKLLKDRDQQIKSHSNLILKALDCDKPTLLKRFKTIDKEKEKKHEDPVPHQTAVAIPKTIDTIFSELANAAKEQDINAIINLLIEVKTEHLTELKNKVINELQKEDKEFTSENHNDYLNLLACIILFDKKAVTQITVIIKVIESFKPLWDRANKLIHFTYSQERSSSVPQKKSKSAKKNKAAQNDTIECQIKMNCDDFASMLKKIQVDIPSAPDPKKARRNIKDFFIERATKTKEKGNSTTASSHGSASTENKESPGVSGNATAVKPIEKTPLTPEQEAAIEAIEKLTKQIQSLNIDTEQEKSKLAALETKITKGQDKVRAMKEYDLSIYLSQLANVKETVITKHAELLNKVAELEIRKSELLVALNSDIKPTTKDLGLIIEQFVSLQKSLADNLSETEKRLKDISKEINNAITQDKKNNLIKKIIEQQSGQLLQEITKLITAANRTVQATKAIFNEYDDITAKIAASNDTKDTQASITACKTAAEKPTQEIESIAKYFDTKLNALSEKYQSLKNLDISQLETALTEYEECNRELASVKNKLHASHQDLIQIKGNARDALCKQQNLQEIFHSKQRIESCNYKVIKLTKSTLSLTEIEQDYLPILNTMEIDEAKEFSLRVKKFLREGVATVAEYESLSATAHTLEKEASQVQSNPDQVTNFLKCYETFNAKRNELQAKITILVNESEGIKVIINHGKEVIAKQKVEACILAAELKNKLAEIKKQLLSCNYSVADVSESALSLDEIKRDYPTVLPLMDESDSAAFKSRVEKFLHNASITIAEQISLLAEAKNLEKEANTLVSAIVASDFESDEPSFASACAEATAGKLLSRVKSFQDRYKNFNTQRDILNRKIAELQNEKREINEKISILWVEFHRPTFASATKSLTIINDPAPGLGAGFARSLTPSTHFGTPPKLHEPYRQHSFHAKHYNGKTAEKSAQHGTAAGIPVDFHKGIICTR